MRDLLGVSVSVGTVHQVLQSAARKADVINQEPDLSAIRVGLHDELFQGAMPVLTGVDAQSTYCYLLAAADHRDADAWGVHLLDATRQGLKPDYTIADAGQGLRAGQKTAWGDTLCHGDVFHIQHPRNRTGSCNCPSTCRTNWIFGVEFAARSQPRERRRRPPTPTFKPSASACTQSSQWTISSCVVPTPKSTCWMTLLTRTPMRASDPEPSGGWARARI
jgi:hypothetical protein